MLSMVLKTIICTKITLPFAMIYQDIDLVWRKCKPYYGTVISTEILRRKYCVIYLYGSLWPILRKGVGYRIHILSCKLSVHLCSIFNYQKLPQDIAIITINDTLLLLLFKSLHFSLQPFPATGHHRDLIATAAVSHRRLDVHLDYGLER